ncbi:MLO-like protein [Vigna angularis]|uniref:MLO-like protein n=1 Tax=Phaseolus angularis TaxID=3914 RepID=A0A8T0JNJ6_PHAAN|nr:MLO-like protein [Vigna angularis]
MGEENGEGRSLADTPTYAVATVITVLVSFSFLFQGTLKKLVKWLDRTKRKSLLSALEKIKEELMLFGLLSLLMGHWIIFVAKICVKSSVISSRFFPCPLEKNSVKRVVWLSSEYSNRTVVKGQVNNGLRNYCPEVGHESLASYESLEQLHRFVFVLGVTHVTYSFLAVALAMIKIYSWRTWENEAKTIAVQSIQDTSQSTSSIRLRRLNTFIFHHTSHPWSHHKILVWLLCFSRQFWSSIHRADYMALRLGFITNHDLPTTYDFHNYMLRSMDEEFRDIVGVSVLLWVYAICCIFLNFHGSNFYFWLSFVPAILILIIGTKLHRVVVKLAVEIINRCPNMKPHQFNLRDELFWFGKPRFLLRLIQLISFLVSNIVFPFCFFIADTLTFFLPVVIFQNAFEMATFLWSLWEIKDPSCFMNNRTFIVIRLSFGVISQVWCSFITFPLYVIITQMGSRFKKTVVSENVRKSLSKWQRRVKERQSYSSALLTATSAASISSFISGNERGLISEEGSSSGTKDICLSYLDHVSRTQADASFPSYENDPHDIIHDSSPPLS